jgi:hypothetical protein
MFNFLTLELCLFIGVIFLYTQMRKKKIYPLEMVRGLTIYLPPRQEDFDSLETTSKPKPVGKKAKQEAKQVSKKAKFPMRSMPMNEELLKYCKVFFAEFEFLFMLFHLILAMFFLILMTKLFDSERIETNMTLYLALMTALLVA